MAGFFLKISAKLGNSIIDWIRSIYFSLFGSTALAFFLKVKALETQTIMFYGLATLCFLGGLFFSVRITDRFKKFEKRFEKEKTTGVNIGQFYINQDKSNSYEHLLLYLLFIPAFIFIAMAGNNIETKANKNSAKMDGSLTELSTQNHYLISKIESLEEKINNLLTKKQELPTVTSKEKTQNFSHKPKVVKETLKHQPSPK